MIVTFGTTTSEVESHLKLNFAIASGTQEGNNLILLIDMVEAFLKEVTGREFEETTFVDQEYDVQPGQRQIQLNDWPVTTFTALKKVTFRSTAGVETLETITQDRYKVDTETGLLRSLGEDFPDGAGVLKASYTAGYTATQITNNSKREIPIWKALELSLIAREWGLAKEQKRHISRIDFADGSASLLFDLDRHQKRLLAMLRRPPYLFR